MSKLSLALAIVAIGLLCVCGGPASAASSLMSYYNFNDTVADQAGVNNGTMIGGAAYTASGTIAGFGKALSLDGIDDQVTLANESNFDFLETAYTISFWMNTQGGFDNAWAQILTKGENYGGWRFLRNGVAVDNVCFNPYGSGSVVQTTASFANSNWHHLVGTADLGVGNEDDQPLAKLYMDGVLVGECWHIPGRNNDTAVSIGSNNGVPGYAFQGLMDDVAFFTEALTAGKAIALNNLGVDSLAYTADMAAGLFEIFDGGPGSTGVVGGETWSYVTGLTGAAGDVLNHSAVVLDASGNGVYIGAPVPEPSTLVLIGTALMGLLAYAWRKRK